MTPLLENIQQLSILVLVVCSFLFYYYLRSLKRERRLSVFERTIYIVIQLAVFVLGGNFLLLVLS
ncbi:hypothetical protein LC087_16345 [Bacillus carboniphilus]|uniref:Uncharacterized protein n=1 Tax=Bacillus carboniphilus TaxID=86663 RepID=A0ABY9JXC5_9BACI|nr:hypothetical protein [Bacillus carboniphilus]WLR42275.1 hypothetical protein LC087_16345 [Bacillus carboniphilus]